MKRPHLHLLCCVTLLSLAACQSAPAPALSSPVGHWYGEYRQSARLESYPMALTLREGGRLDLQDGKYVAEGRWTLNGTTFHAEYTFVRQEASYVLDGEYVRPGTLRGVWRPAAAIHPEGTFFLKNQ